MDDPFDKPQDPRPTPPSEAPPDQLSLFPPHPVVARLRDLDVEKMTPLEALNLLARLREELRGRA